MKTKLLKNLQYILGLIMILSLIPFTYLSLKKNIIATIFVMTLIIIIVGLKLKLSKKIYSKKPQNITYTASYLSEIIAITAIIIMGTLEIYNQAEVGLWFYIVLGAVMLSRPFLLWLLKKNNP